ncbi:MAG: 5-formyltetrahydrofolate cyclo-ligase [Desulfuromonadales bacterium]
MLKTSIRNDILARRRQLSFEECLAQSLRIQNRLLSAPEFRTSARLALYSPILNEVFTEKLFQQARQERMSVAYPRVRGEDLEFVLVSDPGALTHGAFGVMEPSGHELIVPGELDLVVVPGVAFDFSGYRLGYGKGFYDRALHDTAQRTVRAGVCYELQLVDVLPAERHDICMDLIVTENRILRFRSPEKGDVALEQEGMRP